MPIESDNFLISFILAKKSYNYNTFGLYCENILQYGPIKCVIIVLLHLLHSGTSENEVKQR